MKQINDFPSFGEWLRAMLKYRHMTQIQLANLIGVNKTTIRDWVADDHLPNMLYFVEILKALGLSCRIVEVI